LYLTFIRPLLEYAGEVWDNCTLADSERLEKIQLEAARIVTGFRISFLNICWQGEFLKSVGRLFQSLIVLGKKEL
jgi:hypothetical protein